MPSLLLWFSIAKFILFSCTKGFDESGRDFSLSIFEASIGYLWDEELPESPVQLARVKFNIRNGITLVRRSKNYYDMIAVALPNEQDNPGSFYLNKLKTIEQFVHEFDKDNKDLIQLINKNPILLPKSYRDVNYVLTAE